MIHLIVLRVITFLGSWATVLGYSCFEVEEKHKVSEINSVRNFVQNSNVVTKSMNVLTKIEMILARFQLKHATQLLRNFTVNNI